MADVFLSDVHLRLDQPERGRRLAQFVDSLDPADHLYIVGDLCDFWFASRERRTEPSACPGLTSLIKFRRAGGVLTVLLGNHDAWLGPSYELWLETRIVAEPLLVESHGRRILLSHGHRVKGKSWWKAAMETHAFLTLFEHAPNFLARRLDALLSGVNEKTRRASEDRMIAEYRISAQRVEACDVVVFGHVHRALDDPSVQPRLVVLGDWTEGTHFLRLDEQGLIHHSA